MLITFFSFIVYFSGFAYWFRNRLRTYLNNWEREYTFKEPDRFELGFGAILMALFWPVTMPVNVLIRLLMFGIKTEKEKAKDHLEALTAELERLMEVQRDAQNAGLWNEEFHGIIKEKANALRLETDRFKSGKYASSEHSTVLVGKDSWKGK